MTAPLSFPIGCAFVLAAAFAPAALHAQSVQVLDILVLGESRVAGEKAGEFSALVFDPGRQTVLAISDRGYIATLAVDVSGDTLARVDVTAINRLSGPDGTLMPSGRFNPEAAAMMADGTIAIVDETAARLAVFDTGGRWLRDEVLPADVRDVTLQASEVLERTRNKLTDALTPSLRLLDRTDCQAAETCTGQRLSIDLGDLTDADFEGLVHLGKGRFLMVSDDKIDGDLRSVFALIAVE